MSAKVSPRPNTTIEQEVIIQLLAQGGLLLVTLLTQSLLAYILLTEGRGAYAICIMVGGMLGVLFTPGADRGAQYYLMAGKMSVSQSVAIAFTICIVGSALGALLTWPLINSGLTFFEQADASSFYLALALIPLTALSLSLELQLAAFRRFTRIALYTLTRSVVMVIGIALLTGRPLLLDLGIALPAGPWLLDLGVDGALLAVIGGHLAEVLLYLRDLRRHCGLGLERPTRAGFRQVFSYGLRFHVARVVAAFDPRIGILMLGVVATQGEIGLFAAASGIMFRVATIPNALGLSLLPRIAGDGNGQPTMMALYLRLVSMVTGGVLLVLLAVSQPGVRLFLSENFLPVVPLVWIMAPGIYAFAAGKIFETYFSGINRPQVCSWALWIGLIGNVSAFFALYPQWGLSGAAGAFTLGMLLRGLYLAVLFRRTSGLSLGCTWLLQPGDVAFIWTSGRVALSRMKG